MRSLLLIEDVAAQRDLVSQVLQRKEFTVTQVGDGRDAIVWLQQRDFDAIVLDLRLPGCSGEFVVQWILQNRAHLRPRILIVTGDLSAPGLALFFDLKIPVLQKPYSLDQLINAVENVAVPRPGSVSEFRSVARFG
jgi:two-component system sensor histidine kinase TorS